MYNVFPPSGGLKLVVIPSLWVLEEKHLRHPNLIWWNHKQALLDGLEIPTDIKHMVIYSLLASIHPQKLAECAHQSGVEEIFVIKDFKSIIKINRGF